MVWTDFPLTEENSEGKIKRTKAPFEESEWTGAQSAVHIKQTQWLTDWKTNDTRICHMTSTRKKEKKRKNALKIKRIFKRKTLDYHSIIRRRKEIQAKSKMYRSKTEKTKLSNKQQAEENNVFFCCSTNHLTEDGERERETENIKLFDLQTASLFNGMKWIVTQTNKIDREGWSIIINAYLKENSWQRWCFFFFTALSIAEVDAVLSSVRRLRFRCHRLPPMPRKERESCDR